MMDARGGGDAAEDVKKVVEDVKKVTAPDGGMVEGGGCHGSVGAGDAAAGEGALVSAAAVADLEAKKVGVEGDAGVADLEENTGVECIATEADVVVKQAVDDVLDVNPLQSAVDEKVEPSDRATSKKRKVDDDYDDPYEEVNNSDLSPVEYDSDESGVTVDKSNVASFTRQELEKL